MKSYKLYIYLYKDDLKKYDKRPFCKIESASEKIIDSFYKVLQESNTYVKFGNIIFIKKYFHHCKMSV